MRIYFLGCPPYIDLAKNWRKSTITMNKNSANTKENAVNSLPERRKPRVFHYFGVAKSAGRGILLRRSFGSACVSAFNACWQTPNGLVRSVNPISPIGLRGQDSPPAMVQTRRAGCVETCLSGSTEACWRNPFGGSLGPVRRVIPAFYPMACWLEVGRRGKTPLGRAQCPPQRGRVD
jgi:hypothetical protein